MNNYLTYGDILEWLQKKSDSELDQTATVFFEDDKEGYPISFFRQMIGSDVYDDGQLVMSVDPELP